MDDWKGFSDRELNSLRHGVQTAGRRPQAGGRGSKFSGNYRGIIPGPSTNSTARSGGHVHRPPIRKPAMVRGREGRSYGSALSSPSAGAFFNAPALNSVQVPPPNDRTKVEVENQNPVCLKEGEPGQRSESSAPPVDHTPKLSDAAREMSAPGEGLASRREGEEDATGLSVQSSTEANLSLNEGPRVSLEELQRQQRDIEAENKKSKALIEKALQERYKKSQLEAKTLEAVKKELGKLDMQVSRDVSILRDRIEEANRQYTTARKRYEQAEVEFVSAKMELHRSSELKELMSEHLCTVIQQNEVRKAKKLAELLQALNVEGPDGSVTLPALFKKTPTPGLDIWPRGGRPRTHSKTDSVKDGKPLKETTEKEVTASLDGRDSLTVTREENTDNAKGPSDEVVTLLKDKKSSEDVQLSACTSGGSAEASHVQAPHEDKPELANGTPTQTSAGSEVVIDLKSAVASATGHRAPSGECLASGVGTPHAALTSQMPSTTGSNASNPPTINGASVLASDGTGESHDQSPIGEESSLSDASPASGQHAHSRRVDSEARHASSV